MARLKNKNLTDNFNSLRTMEGEKMPKKVKKNEQHIFFVLNKYQSVTHVSKCFLKGFSK